MTGVGLVAMVTIVLVSGLTPAAAGAQEGASAGATSGGVVATSIPGTPAGMQLSWLLGAFKNLPLSASAAQSHFDAAFLAQVPTTGLNNGLAELGGVPIFSGIITSDGAPGQNPSGLLAVVTVGLTRFEVTLTTDAAGLISGLLFTRYLAPPTSWAALDRDLAQIAPDIGFLSARVSPSGTCEPIHSIAPRTARPLGSMFKLFVLGALAQRIARGRRRGARSSPWRTR